MRKLAAVLLLLLVSFASCKRKPEDILARINSKYKEINEKQKKLTEKQVDNITSSGTGTITGYYRDDELKKMISEHYTDSNRTFTEYYFDDGMLIFILQQKYVYNCPISYTEEKAKTRNDSVWYDDKKTKLEVSSFWFDKNKLIKWVDDENYSTPPNTPEFTDKQSELWAEAVILIKQLKEQ